MWNLLSYYQSLVLFCLFHNPEKHWNISTSYNKHTIMVIQTDLNWTHCLSTCMFYNETYLLYTLYFDELGPCVCNKLKRYVTGPWFSWNSVNIILSYFCVEMVSWQRWEHVKLLIPSLTEYKTYSWNIGVLWQNMNACPLSLYKAFYLVSTNLSMIQAECHTPGNKSV